MKVKEATVQDKLKWDSFVDENDGDFMHYFDWESIYELDQRSPNQTTALMIETDHDQWSGICHLTKINKTFYSKLVIYAAPGILFRKGISDDERAEGTSVLLGYIKKYFASKCSSITILEEGDSLNQNHGKCNKTFLEHGFQVISSRVPGLPCAHILPVKPPFKENIWERLWSSSLRQKIRKVEKSDIRVIQDKEFKYLNTFLDMLAANYKRHYASPPDRDRMIAELDAFKKNSKLFVALEHDRPLVATLCHYTLSTCFLWEMGSYDKGTNNVNTYCYKMAIEDACNSGYKYIHFGRSYTEGLANFKDLYKAVRVPIIEYEKKYSSIRKLLEKAQGVMVLTLFVTGRVIHDHNYLWDKGNVVWGKIIRRQVGTT
jgi:hypothetical protein